MGSICPCRGKKLLWACCQVHCAVTYNKSEWLCVLHCQHRGCPRIRGNAAHHSPSSASSQGNQRSLECCIIIEVLALWPLGCVIPVQFAIKRLMLVSGMAIYVNTITETLVCSHPFSWASDGKLRAFVNRHCSNWICSSFPAVHLDITDGMERSSRASKILLLLFFQEMKENI